MITLIFKIEIRQRWQDAKAARVYSGAPVDHADGFIHFSAADQVAQTLARHFADQTGLLLIAVDADALGTHLKWEPSRGGALFPHLYGQMPMQVVRGERPIPDTHDLEGFADWGISA